MNSIKLIGPGEIPPSDAMADLLTDAYDIVLAVRMKRLV
jgi:hypothetical protein